MPKGLYFYRVFYRAVLKMGALGALGLALRRCYNSLPWGFARLVFAVRLGALGSSGRQPEYQPWGNAPKNAGTVRVSGRWSSVVLQIPVVNMC